MKQIIYCGLVFVLFASSCKTISHQVVLNNIPEELPEQTPKPVPPGSRADDIPPSFPGGEKAMQNFINSNKRYPQSDSLMGKQGTVFVLFTVTYTGKLSDFEIVRSLTPDCDAEALRIIKSMPKWIPASRNEETFDMKVGLPIRFGVQSKEE